MSKFVAGFLSLMVGNVLQLGTNFLFSLVMLQKLSTAEIGKQSTIVSFAGIVSGLANLGLLEVGTRELARQSGEQQQRTYTALLCLQITLSGSACLAIMLIAWALNTFPGALFIIFVLGLFTLLFSYAPIFPTEALMAVHGRVRRIAIFQSIYAVGTAILGIMILLAGGGIDAIYVALSLLSAVMIVLYLREASHLLGGRLNFGSRLSDLTARWGYYVRQGLPGGLSSTLILSCLLLGTPLVYTFVGKIESGYLGVCLLVIQAVVSIVWVPYAINILPVMSRLQVGAPDRLKWLISRSVTWLISATVPIALGGMLLAPDVLQILSVQQVPAAPTLRIMIWVLPLNVLASFMYRSLLVLTRQKRYLVATAAGAITNLALCALLIPAWGVQGAAVATITSLGLIVVICAGSLRDWLWANLRPLDLLRLILALTGMVIAVQATAGLSVFVRIAAGGIVYGALAFGSRLLRLNDWHDLRHLLSH